MLLQHQDDLVELLHNKSQAAIMDKKTILRNSIVTIY